jgi:Stage II sporulation protein E (SpoIIE)
MLKRHPGSICTALCLRLGPDGVTLAIGGHPLPVYLDGTGARLVGEYGPLLGAFEGAEWRDIALEFAAGGTLVIYTDGVTDAVGAEGERYGLRRFQATLDRCRDMSARGVIDGLTEALRGFQVGEHADDTAALALRRLPADVPDDRRGSPEEDRAEALATSPQIGADSENGQTKQVRDQGARRPAERDPLRLG